MSERDTFVAVCPHCGDAIRQESGTVGSMWYYEAGQVTIDADGNVEAGDPYDQKIGDVEDSGEWWCQRCVAPVTPVCGARA